MKIKKLELTNFRNYDHLVLENFRNINIIIGANGVGKTNIVESIYLLSLARSFRTNVNKNLIKFSNDFCKVSAKIETERNHNLEIIIGKDFKKAKIDRNDIDRISEYVGILNVVVFTPDDLNLVKGAPQIKRKFLNLELSKISPIYIFNFNKFHNLLKERNKYLKITERYDEYLEVIDEQIVKLQLEINRKRREFVDLLNEIVEPTYQKIAANNDTINLKLDSDFDMEKETQTYLDMYKQSFKKDKRYLKTVFGIHHDNLRIFLNSKEAKHFASQGQIRTIVLSIKIALVELVRREIGEYPVLLLDDVMSELDYQRQNNLLHFLSQDIQTFITTTSFDGLIYEVIENANKIYIEGVTNGR